MNFKQLLENKTARASVPCRIDLGGTLDISTFFLPLAHMSPASFNIALDMRTFVTLFPHTPGRIKVSSRGFETAEFEQDKIRFDHPMGLMFACAQYFNAHGVHIHIESTSPPKSALGGSSSAAVAIIAAFFKLLDKKIEPESIAWLAHYLESSVAGVPCGVQDQAAAAYGGGNLWEWKMGKTGPLFVKIPVFETKAGLDRFNDNILVAYCGIPHVSKDINKQWVDSFLRGESRVFFEKIARITKDFYSAIKDRDYRLAADLMNQEVELRIKMTPEVLDKTGKKLFERARLLHCGARFTGAGGGGCLWAVGDKADISLLARSWEEVLVPIKGAKILDTQIDPQGILFYN